MIKKTHDQENQPHQKISKCQRNHYITSKLQKIFKSIFNISINLPANKKNLDRSRDFNFFYKTPLVEGTPEIFSFFSTAICSA